MSPPRFERGGIVVAEASPIHSLADLRGRSIALMPVSWHTQFLAAELDAANIEWRAVNAVELTPATAKEAFFAGLLDAIVATDPLLAQIEAARPVRILGKPGAAFSNRSVYWGRQDVLRDQPRAVQALVDALSESDRRTQENPAEAATLLDGVNGTSASHWLDALKVRPWGITVPDDDFLDEQQRHADVFTRFGLIDRPIDVSDTITRGYPAQAPRPS
jgi:ABC-type nitrate/sulfonate/bicarbonate transport system substrate-binding protein